MRTIFILFDSLNRRFLPNYGCDWVQAPNFERLGKRSVTFENAYVGSMPCMPARRELHTGRYNFLHRSWGPLEPFDDSVPELLRDGGVYTHLISDHQHYWEDGGATYHARYSSWEIVRGQEGDPWKADLDPAITPTHHLVKNEGRGKGNYHMARMPVQDMINRAKFKTADDLPQSQVFSRGLEFLQTNRKYDNWMLQIESFDPHEPFFTKDEFRELYRDKITDGDTDWPPYAPCTEGEDAVRDMRAKYAAMVSMCDRNLGRVLDFMDAHDMWKDTALIVTTDHGYLLGEHDWWAKNVMPLYNEVANIPLFIWDPRVGQAGQRRRSLAQNIDVAATLLELNGIELPPDMQGRPLKGVVERDEPVHDCVLFGNHGSHVNITDGRYVYFRAPIERENAPIYEYTVMPMHMNTLFSPEELRCAELAEAFSFTKGVRLLRIPAPAGKLAPVYRFGSRLYDLTKDPGQLAPIEDPETELRLLNAMREQMLANDAPAEQYSRIGIHQERPMTMEELLCQKKAAEALDSLPPVEGLRWTKEAREAYLALALLGSIEDLPIKLKAFMAGREGDVTLEALEKFVQGAVPEEKQGDVLKVLALAGRLF